MFNSFISIAKGTEFVKCNNKKRFRKNTINAEQAKAFLSGSGSAADEKYLRSRNILDDDEAFQPAIGYLVPDGEIVVDIDEGFDKILRLLKKLNVKTTYTYSKRGGHLFFKLRENQRETIKNTNDCINVLGIRADIKTAGGYVILPEGRPERRWGKVQEFAYLPYFLEPLKGKKKTESLFGLGDGDGRNSALVSHIGTLWNRGFSEKRCKQVATWINDFIFDTPLPEKEMRASVLSVLNYEQNEEIKTKAENDKYNLYLFYNDKGKPFKVNQAAIVDQIVKENLCRNVGNNCFYYKSGYWQFGELLLMERIKELIKDPFLVTSQNVNSCYNLAIKDNRLQISTDEFNKSRDFINFSDCVYDTKNGLFLDHKPDYMFNYQLPHKIKPLGVIKGRRGFSQTNFGRFLEKTCGMSRDDEKMLMEFLAACLSGKVSTKCFLMLTGKPNTGKSVLLHFLEKMIGNINCSAIPLQDLNNHRFALAEIFGKRINICADIPSEALKKTDKLKQITGGDYVSGERKGKDIFRFQPQCLLAFSCNQLPLFLEEKSNAVYTRMRVLTMDNEIELTNTDVQELWSEESVAEVLPYLLGLLPVENVSNSESSRKAVLDVQEESDSIVAFLNHATKNKKSSKVLKRETYEYYVDFCNYTGRQPFGLTAFYKHMAKKGKRTYRVNGSNYYKGLELIPFDDE